MGEKEPEKDDSEKKSAGAGPLTVVLKVNLHCEGCAHKVKKSLKHLSGVESVKAEYTSNKVTVVGKVDPAYVKARVEEKTRNKAALVSPLPPKKDNDGAAPPGSAASSAGIAEKPEQKPDKKPDEPKQPEEKKPPAAVTVVLKTRVHCDGCANKMKKIISKYEGVQDVNVDLSKDQVAIKGTMDVKEMLPYLNAKLKRPVDVVPPPAKKDDAAGDEKPKEASVNGGDTKGKEEVKSAASGGDAKQGDAKADAGGKQPAGNVEIVNKMEHSGYPYGYGAHTYYPQQSHQNGYVAQYWHASNASNYNHAPRQYMPGPSCSHAPQQYMPGRSYAHAPGPSYAPVPHQYMPRPSYAHAPGPSYALAPPQYMPGPSYLHVPHMFSDEDPNACSVM